MPPSTPHVRTTQPSPKKHKDKKHKDRKHAAKKTNKLASALSNLATKLKQLVHRRPRRSTTAANPSHHGMVAIRRIPSALLSTEFMLGEIDDLSDDDVEGIRQPPRRLQEEEEELDQQQQHQHQQHQQQNQQSAGRRRPLNLDKSLPALPVEARRERVRDSWMTVERWVE